MKTAIPWVLLGALILYRRTWGAKTADDVDDLRRRLSVAHRETADWQNEARHWRAEAEKYRDMGYGLAEQVFKAQVASVEWENV
ncbi:hypothetical protein ACFWY9_28770 [Amycolatopsis sp. NPDC059027]|uniref:hypothetical protein n=1 Tax=Amycolatopsis sp. NPDC059027 TaxID=3346709 RepID=UPI00366EAD3E